LPANPSELVHILKGVRMICVNNNIFFFVAVLDIVNNAIGSPGFVFPLE
jgi:hypothetical protein